jgi:AraC-like DNA-binding protein
LIEANYNNSQIVDVAIFRILQSKGLVRVSAILKELHISERTLERYFKQYVGVSPQKFIRICRFQAAFQQIQSFDYEKLTDIAYDLGYADQAHFIREFKAFFGTAPLQLQKNQADFLSNIQIFSS